MKHTVESLVTALESHCAWQSGCGYGSRLEYLAAEVFNFTTYNSSTSEMFARKALEVVAAITNGTTLEYIRQSDDHHTWFILMCNMRYFRQAIDWGTSIRAAFWLISDKVTQGMYYDNAHHDLVFEEWEEWEDFQRAVLKFAEPEFIPPPLEKKR